MPIEEIPNGGGTVFTGEGVTLYQLLSQRSAVRLEKAGLRVGRGRRLWCVYRDHYLIPNAKGPDDVIAWLDQKIAEVGERVKGGA